MPSLSALLLLLGLAPSLSAGMTPAEIRVAVYDYPPLCRTDLVAASGSVDDPSLEGGFFVVLLQQVARLEGWRLRWVPGTLAECLTWLQAGDVDLMVACPYLLNQSRAWDVSTVTAISTWAQVYTRAPLRVQSALDLDGHAVGVRQDDPANEELRRTAAQFGIQCRFVEFADYHDVLEALNQGWVDAGVVDRLYGAVSALGADGVEASPLILAPVEMRFAVPSGRRGELLAALDYHLQRMKADPDSPYHRLLEQVARAEQQSPLARRLALGLGVAAVLVLLFLGASLLLRRTVRRQTRELIRRNQDLQLQNDLRRRAEVALFRANRVLEKTFASMQDALIVFAPDKRRILSFNRSATGMFGYTEQDLPQTPLRQLLADQADLGRLGETHPSAATRAGATGYHCEMRRRDGTTFQAELSLTPLEANLVEEAGWVMHVRDLTERLRGEEALQQTEARLRQAQKMEAIGTLAGGIAHDFNNILTPIIGYTELMADILQSGECPDGSYVEQIHQAAVRARDLVAQILTFSRRQEREPIELCLVPIVKEVIKLLRATLPTTVRIELALKVENDRVLIDPTQVHQVLLNLCTNAAHAMRREGGVLRISVRDHEGPPRGWGTHSTLSPGPYLCLEVSDTGHGIEPSILPRVFDPFFTTKGLGEGTGMGLAVVHGIVESCGGAVTVESEPGNGTVFRVYLPRGCREVTAEPSVDPAQPDDGQYGRGERILLVDDEPLVVNAVAATLRHEGYEVDTQSDPRQALTRLRGAPNEVDLLLTDQTMPGMTGLHLAREALVVCPGLPVVLLSGLPGSIDQHECQALGIAAVLPKPFRPTQLSRTLRRALDGEHQS